MIAHLGIHGQNQDWPVVTFGELTPGVEFDIDGEAWRTVSVEPQGFGVVHVRATDPHGVSHTLVQRADDRAYLVF